MISANRANKIREKNAKKIDRRYKKLIKSNIKSAIKNGFSSVEIPSLDAPQDLLLDLEELGYKVSYDQYNHEYVISWGK